MIPWHIAVWAFLIGFGIGYRWCAQFVKKEIRVLLEESKTLIDAEKRRRQKAEGWR